MGHDIYAYKDSEHDDEIAYLRRGCMTSFQDKFEIYFCFDSLSSYNSVSGNGEEIEYNLRDCITALSYATTSDVKDFIQKCIDYLKDNKEKVVYIVFS